MELCPEEQAAVDLVQELCRREIAPRAAAIDQEAVFPRGVYDTLQAAGLVGLLVTQEDGGFGASLTLTCLVYELVSAASASCALILSNSVEALIPIARFAAPTV